jgi:hypothetical protein
MLYNISGAFHFLGFDVNISLDIESLSYQDAVDFYRKTFSNFFRLKDITDYLTKTNQIEILNSIPQESEYSALIYLEIIESTKIDSEIIEDTLDPEIGSPVIVKDGSDAVPGLKTALQNQDPGVYKIRIVDNEPIIIGKPKDRPIDLPDNYNDEVNSQRMHSNFGFKTDLKHINL